MRITKSLLNEEVIFSVYQPIVTSIKHSVFAYEALVRTKSGLSPLEIFKNARHHELLYELDTDCITNAITEFPPSYQRDYNLFINIFPSTIVHKDFERFISILLNQCPWIKRRVVFEINEEPLEELIWGKPLLLKRITLLKNLGFGIAFDDITLSNFSYKKIELLTPDFIKLDHTISKNLSHSLIQQQLVSYFVEFANKKINLVLEGIESEEDLTIAKELRVLFLQGFHLGKPQALLINEVDLQLNR